MGAMTDTTDKPNTAPIPTLDDMQQWTLVMARTQQMLMEAWADNLAKGSAMPGLGPDQPPASTDPMLWMSAGAEAWSKGVEAWSQIIGQATQAGETRDRRFGSPEWKEPIFATVRQSYQAISDKLLGTVEK